jgi:hypothetical protein
VTAPLLRAHPLQLPSLAAEVRYLEVKWKATKYEIDLNDMINDDEE